MILIIEFLVSSPFFNFWLKYINKISFDEGLINLFCQEINISCKNRGRGPLFLTIGCQSLFNFHILPSGRQTFNRWFPHCGSVTSSKPIREFSSHTFHSNWTWATGLKWPVVRATWMNWSVNVIFQSSLVKQRGRKEETYPATSWCQWNPMLCTDVGNPENSIRPPQLMQLLKFYSQD